MQPHRELRENKLLRLSLEAGGRADCALGDTSRYKRKRKEEPNKGICMICASHYTGNTTRMGHIAVSERKACCLPCVPPPRAHRLVPAHHAISPSLSLTHVSTSLISVVPSAFSTRCFISCVHKYAPLFDRNVAQERW